MKKLLALSLALLLLFALAACAAQYTIGAEEVDAVTQDLLTEMGYGNWQDAAALFHPDAKVTADSLKAFYQQAEISGMATVASVDDFVYEPKDERYHGAVYDCMLTLNTKGGPVPMSLSVLRNEKGFGILHVHIPKAVD